MRACTVGAGKSTRIAPRLTSFHTRATDDWSPGSGVQPDDEVHDGNDASVVNTSVVASARRSRPGPMAVILVHSGGPVTAGCDPETDSADDAGLSEAPRPVGQAQLGEDLVGVLAEAGRGPAERRRGGGELRRVAGEAGPARTRVVGLLEQPDGDGVGVAG